METIPNILSAPKADASLDLPSASNNVMLDDALLLDIVQPDWSVINPMTTTVAINFVTPVILFKANRPFNPCLIFFKYSWFFRPYAGPW